jgi:hypothetical protein
LLFTVAFVVPVDASQKRLGLVVGNASYTAQPLEAVAREADFIASSLRKAGFDVTGARDLNREGLAKTFYDFVEKVSKAGPDAVVVVYFGGYALQFEGENFLLPVDADVDIDVAEISSPSRLALHVSDLTRALSALHPKGALVILDAARGNPFLLSGQPPVSGLAWLETGPNVVMASSAAPGMVSSNSRSSDGYGAYAKAIAGMIGDENSTLADALVRVRMRVNEITRGEQVPWHSSGIGSQLALSERVTRKGSDSQDLDRLRSRPMAGLSEQDAYFAALLRDTLDSYADYLADHWRDRAAKRIRALLVVRREVLLWHRACRAGASEDFWSYLERYPEGPHAGEARRILQRRKAATVPPSAFKRPEYDIPSPLPGEADYLASPSLGFEPPPPAPSGLLGLAVESMDTSTPLTSEKRDSAAQSNLSIEQGATILEKKASSSQPSNIKQTWSPNSLGSTTEGRSDVQAGVGVPYWAYPDLAPVTPKADFTGALASRFPEWATFGLWPREGDWSSSTNPAFTRALIPLASRDINMLEDRKAGMSLTAPRSSLTEPASVTPRVRIPLPVARPAAVAPLQGTPKQPLSSRRLQPTSSLSFRPAVPPSR